MFVFKFIYLWKGLYFEVYNLIIYRGLRNLVSWFKRVINWGIYFNIGGNGVE